VKQGVLVICPRTWLRTQQGQVSLIVWFSPDFPSLIPLGKFAELGREVWGDGNWLRILAGRPRFERPMPDATPRLLAQTARDTARAARKWVERMRRLQVFDREVEVGVEVAFIENLAKMRRELV